MTKAIEIPKEAQELATDAKSALELAEKVVIDTNDGYEQAAGMFKEINEKIKAMDAKRKSMTKPLDESKKRIMDFFRGPIDFLEKAKKTVKRAMIVYQDKLEQDRIEAQKEADRLAEKEAKYQAGLAEKRAARAEKKGDIDKAEEIREEKEEIHVVAPIVASMKPKSKGVAIRENWSAKVVDKKALIKAVAEGRAPETLIIVDMKVANQMARALKGSMGFDGLKAVVSRV